MPADPHIDVRSSPQPVSAEVKPLDLTLRIRADRDGQKWSVTSGDTLKTGDLLELFVYLKQPAYLYVLEVLPDGTFMALFPDKGNRLLMAGREHRIPDAAEESFQVDSNDKEENIYLLMSRVPVARPSALIPAAYRRVSAIGEQQHDSLLHDPPRSNLSITTPEAASPRRPDRVLSITTRRVIRVKRPDATPALVDTAVEREDSTLVIRLHFKHV
jgi:hypothetical protein